MSRGWKEASTHWKLIVFSGGRSNEKIRRSSLAGEPLMTRRAEDRNPAGHLVDRCVKIGSRTSPSAPGVHLVSLLLKCVLHLAASGSLDRSKEHWRVYNAGTANQSLCYLRTREKRSGRRCRRVWFSWRGTIGCLTIYLLAAGLQLVQGWVAVCISSSSGHEDTFLHTLVGYCPLQHTLLYVKLCTVWTTDVYHKPLHSVFFVTEFRSKRKKDEWLYIKGSFTLLCVVKIITRVLLNSHLCNFVCQKHRITVTFLNKVQNKYYTYIHGKRA